MGVDLEHSLYALDSTTIDLCLSLFPWARFRQHKAAVKMHTLLDLHGNIPTFVRVTDGKVHDVNILDEIVPEAGAFYVMDRGYIRFSIDFTSSHSARRFSFCYQRECLTATSLFTSGGPQHRRALRSHRHSNRHRIRQSLSGCTATGELPGRRKPTKRLKFLTNNFVLPALTIAQTYKCRWQVELFFESSTWCTPSDAMEFQGSIALIDRWWGCWTVSVRTYIVRRPLCAESKVRPRKLASPIIVSAESSAIPWSA